MVIRTVWQWQQTDTGEWKRKTHNREKKACPISSAEKMESHMQKNETR